MICDISMSSETMKMSGSFNRFSMRKPVEGYTRQHFSSNGKKDWELLIHIGGFTCDMTASLTLRIFEGSFLDHTFIYSHLGSKRRVKKGATTWTGILESTPSRATKKNSDVAGLHKRTYATHHRPIGGIITYIPGLGTQKGYFSVVDTSHLAATWNIQWFTCVNDTGGVFRVLNKKKRNECISNQQHEMRSCVSNLVSWHAAIGGNNFVAMKLRDCTWDSLDSRLFDLILQ